MLYQIKKEIIGLLRKNTLEKDQDKLCKRINRWGRYSGFRLNVLWDEEKNLYHVVNENDSIYVSQKNRLKMFGQGVDKRINQLCKQYLADSLKLEGKDLVVDVGANIGEFSLCLAKNRHVRIVAIEPELPEFNALRENLNEYEAEVHNTALWDSACELEFYHANENGDSSLFAQEGRPSSKVKAISIDDLAGSSPMLSGGAMIKLLKVEAEGAEPEILSGATSVLERTEYVTVDVGAERGMNRESTLVPVLSIMLDAGFDPIEFSLPRAVILFKKKQAT